MTKSIHPLGDEYLASIRDRAARAFQDRPIDVQATDRIRAIVGPQLRAGESTDATFQLAAEGAARLKSFGTAGFVPPTPEQLAALELVIRALRPAPLTDARRVHALPPEASKAFPDWAAFREASGAILYSIGRLDVIERTNPLRTTAIGTGFLVAPRLLLTNAHVLDQLSRGSFMLARGQSIVRFRYEHGTSDTETVEVIRVVDVSDTVDLALFEIERSANSPVTLEAEEMKVGDPVVTVGYPVEDSRNPGFVAAMFGTQFGVKRAAPGEVLRLRRASFFHDCSTLAGNSGSPVLAMRTGHLVGVHRDGFFLSRNEAVDVLSVRSFISPHLAT